MPKQRITKEMVVEAAFELAREAGMENVLVKSIADKIGCSVQPVYCYCTNMEGLKEEVIAYTRKYLEQYVKGRIDTDNIFRSTGIAFANFAKQEPNLYRLYFLRKRDSVKTIEEILETETDPQIARAIADKMGISLENAKEFHRHMMIYNVGMSFILTSLGKDTDIEQITELLNQAFTAFGGMYT